jgi:hypothetical protein
MKKEENYNLRIILSADLNRNIYILFPDKNLLIDMKLFVGKYVILVPKLSDFIFYIIVASGFSLRFSSSDGGM